MMSTNSHFEHVLVFKTFMPLQVLTSGMVYVFDCASFTILRLNIKQQRKIDKKKKLINSQSLCTWSQRRVECSRSLHSDIERVPKPYGP